MWPNSPEGDEAEEPHEAEQPEQVECRKLYWWVEKLGEEGNEPLGKLGICHALEVKRFARHLGPIVQERHACALPIEALDEDMVKALEQRGKALVIAQPIECLS